MINKQLFLYQLIAGTFTIITTFLMILLYSEYRFFRNQVRELQTLKEQYSHYIVFFDHTLEDPEHLTEESFNSLDSFYPQSDNEDEEISVVESLLLETPVGQEEIQTNNNHNEDDDNNYSDSFIIINRHPDYLNESTLEYMQTHDIYNVSCVEKNEYFNPRNTTTPIPLKKKKSLQQSHTNKELTDISYHNTAFSKNLNFIWPIDKDKFWISSYFGPRKRVNNSWGFHHGIDMAAIKGTNVKAVRGGTIIEASFQTGYGNTVLIKHSGSIKTRYAHLHTIAVHNGQIIQQGTIVGTVGETGSVRKKGKDGSHLHFEVYEHDKRINPLHCLPRIV